MKIALYVHCFFPAHFYGTEAYTLALAKELLAHDHDVVVVTAVHAGEPAQKSLIEETLDTDLAALTAEIEVQQPIKPEREDKQSPKRLPLPAHLPRYVMGVGKPIDLVESVARGIDMFDCVLPTRSGRHGQAWTWNGPVNVTNAKFAEDLSPLDSAVDCPASRDFSRAYLHHLFKAGEYLGPMVLSWHNTAFFQALMAEIRAAIAEGRFEALRARLSSAWAGTRSAPKEGREA
jgi:hypothetical protein